MQKTWNKFTSLVIACVMMIASMFAAIATLVIPQTTAVAAETATYKKVTEALSDWSGEYLIVYEDGPYAFNSSLSSIDAKGNYVSVEIQNNKITTDRQYAFTIAKAGSGYSILSTSGLYIGRNGSSNGMDESKTTVHSNTLGVNSIKNSSGIAFQFYNSGSNSRFRYYASSQKAIALYKLDEGGTVVVPDDIKTALNGVEASMSLSYKYTKSTKTVDSSEGVTLSFSDKANRTYFSTTQQIWQANGITLTNDKAGSSSAVADYANPVRFYSKSTLTIEYPKMTSITLTSATGSDYVSALNTTLTNAGHTFEKNDNVFTVTFNGPTDSCNLTLSGQVRLQSLTVYGGSAEATTLGDSEFRIRFSVNASSLSAIEKIVVEGGNLTTDYGIRVSTANDVKPFSFKGKEAVDGKYYVVISLGDIINDTEKLTTEFTVQAYITYSGSEVTPDNPAEGETTNAIKNYSVKTMVEMYHGMDDVKDDVAHLYNYLTTGEL